MSTALSKESHDPKILLYKKNLRKEISQKARLQAKAGILEKSAAIKKKLFALEEFKKARCVVCYVSMSDEVDTHQIIDESIGMGKVIGVPVIVKGTKELMISRITDRIRQLEIGPYGIYQPRQDEVRPIQCTEIELVLVPALAFDRDGNRLGRGKGYYDRFLTTIPAHALTVGLCFDFQVVESVLTLPHDIPVQTLITN